jgi:hypothetical protein
VTTTAKEFQQKGSPWDVVACNATSTFATQCLGWQFLALATPRSQRAKKPATQRASVPATQQPSNPATQQPSNQIAKAEH